MRITIEIDETPKGPGPASVDIQSSAEAAQATVSGAVTVFDGGPAPVAFGDDNSLATTLADTPLNADGLAAGPAPAL